jgi:uncharacterized protein (TIGR03086 family)
VAELDLPYAAALDQVTGLIAGTSPDQLSRPTPCAGWDVRALLNHVLGGMERFAAMAAGQSVDWSAEIPDDLGPDLAARFRAGRTALEAAYREHPENIERVRPTHLIETAVHGWDLAKATDQVGDLDPGVAEAALTAATERLTPEVRKRTTAFGQEVPIRASAPPYERLAAFLGRKP